MLETGNVNTQLDLKVKMHKNKDDIYVSELLIMLEFYEIVSLGDIW